ncbi:MAG: hypothetical protein N2257_07205 [Thermodesulfovibrionales bacterium]|nr:hypothetical protein [Thermodesulfovibrionales bacterium]
MMLISGCTKKISYSIMETVTVPEMSFQEYLSELDSFEKIKFLFTIKVNRGGEEMSGNASMTVNGKDLLLRVYSFGFLLSEIKLSEGNIITEGRKIPEERAYLLMEALRSCLMWWEMDEREVEEWDHGYIVRNSWKKVYINRKYLPEKQEIYLPEVTSVVMTYNKPVFYLVDEKENRGLWFPSEITVKIQDTETRLDIEKMTILN